ncbi:MAG TPA: LacI family DNA-binding transcriptional regulator, partial [Longimicrobium sp.]|nr:LacI family DNA-binding transcriptional regulator [Longimicrobium sp.]
MAEAAVTIRDVAREAGVSVATVSRVLNGSGPVREETRERVWEVAKSLRYMPNEAARSLITRETRTLGVVLPDLYGEFFSEVIRGIDQGAQRERYHVLVSGSHDHWDEIAAAMRVMHRRVDGLIIMSPDIEAGQLRAALPPGLPAVLLNCAAQGREIAAINIDNRGGARAMVQHLAARGHRRLAFIQGPRGNHDASERLAGFREALAAAALPRRREWELAGDFTEEGGYRAIARLLES